MASQRLGEMKGEISTETVPRMQVEWDVPENIIFLPRDTDHTIHSPSFHFKGATWYLRLKIHARELQASQYLVDPIHLYLVKKYSASTVLRVIYHIGIKGHSENEYTRWYSELPISFNETDEDCWGEFSLFDKSKLSRRKASQAPSGVVRFFCHFWVETAENSYSASRTSLSGVQSTIVSNQLSENIGEISTEILTTMYVEWKVSDIALLSEDTKHRISSSSFQFKDEVWYLKAIIHETESWRYRRVPRINGPIDIHLMRKECTSPTLYVECSIGLKMIDGNICNIQLNEYVFDTNSDCRILTYLSRLGEKIMHSANGAVTFFFYFRVESSGCSNAGFQKMHKGLDYKSPPTLNISGSSASNQMHITDTTLEAISALKISGESTNKKSSNNQTIIQGLEKLGTDFRNLFLNCEDSDVIIRVKNKEFKVHKYILRARSTVFYSMFAHDMVEKNSGIVDIADCNPDAFEIFLLYLYSGCIENLSTNTVFDLFTVADKYDTQELRHQCKELMVTNLSVDTVCDVIELALQYKEAELLKTATDFFAKNLKDIIATVKWQSFLLKHTIEANELLIKALN